MSQTAAGWYPDPSGNDSFLRYWDGSAWTDQTLPTRTQPQADPQPQAQQTQPQAQPQQPQQQTCTQAQPQPQQAYSQPQPQPQAQQAQGTTTNIYIQANDRLYHPGALYPMTETDKTLRLIAFVWNAVVLACTCFAIIPLAWEIPMLVRSWGIYKGTKPNTTAFGVCNLIFFGFVSGLLLLCSNKDQ